MNPGMAAQLAPVNIPVERSAAMMRAIWRLVLVIFGMGILSIVQPNWQLLRLTDSASFWALILLLLIVGAATLIILASALRWLLLAVWPKPVGITVNADAIHMRLGPFGVRRFEWADITADFGDAIAPELTEAAPGYAPAPKLVHRDQDDLFVLILRFSRIDAESLARTLVPFTRYPQGA